MTLLARSPDGRPRTRRHKCGPVATIADLFSPPQALSCPAWLHVSLNLQSAAPLRLLRVLSAACLALALWMPGTPAHGEPQNITRGEVARLPEFCTDALNPGTGTRDSPSERQRRWVLVMGIGYWASHHYCWAMINATRASYGGASKAERHHLLHSAIADINYVIQNSQPKFVLLPELYTRIGDYQVQMERPVDAMESYQMAREAKPDYWPAYLRMARVQEGLGQLARAVETLNEGLRATPDQPELLKALSQVSAPGQAASATRTSKRAASAP